MLGFIWGNNRRVATGSYFVWVYVCSSKKYLILVNNYYYITNAMEIFILSISLDFVNDNEFCRQNSDGQLEIGRRMATLHPSICCLMADEVSNIVARSLKKIIRLNPLFEFLIQNILSQFICIPDSIIRLILLLWGEFRPDCVSTAAVDYEFKYDQNQV